MHGQERAAEMTEIRQHLHVYLLFAAAILIGLGGLLSIWRVGAIERQYQSWFTNQGIIISNQSLIIHQNEQLIREHAVLLEHIAREEAAWKGVKP